MSAQFDRSKQAYRLSAFCSFSFSFFWSLSNVQIVTVNWEVMSWCSHERESERESIHTDSAPISVNSQA